MNAFRVFGSRMLRLYFRSGSKHRVWFGPLRGMKLCTSDEVNIQEQLGLWETSNFRVLSQLVDHKLVRTTTGTVMYDVGASFGLYSLFFSILLQSGRVFAFEPAEAPRDLLVRNLSANGIDNVIVEAKACCDKCGEVQLRISPNHHTSSIFVERSAADSSLITVPASTLDDHWKTARRAGEKVSLVKMDIEGAGEVALSLCQYIANSDRPFFLIESHSPAEDAAIGGLASACKYQLYRTSDGRWVESPTAVWPDRRGIWGTLLLVPDELADSTRSLL